jgi:hypothetical protein
MSLLKCDPYAQLVAHAPHRFDGGLFTLRLVENGLISHATWKLKMDSLSQLKEQKAKLEQVLSGKVAKCQLTPLVGM